MLAFLATTLISPISISQSHTLSIVREDWHLIFIGSGARHILLISIAVLFACLLVVELAGFGFTVFIRTLWHCS